MEAENPVLSSTGLSDNDRGVMKDEFHAATRDADNEDVQEKLLPFTNFIV